MRTPVQTQTFIGVNLPSFSCIEFSTLEYSNDPMEDFILFALVVAVGFLFVRLASVRREIQKLDDLKERLRFLTDRVISIEQRSTATAPPAPSAQTAPLSTAAPQQPVSAPAPALPLPANARWAPQTIPAPPASRTVPLAPMSPSQRPAEAPSIPSGAIPSSPAEPPRHISLEERLGQNWLNKLGIVTLVIGLSLFLGYQLRTLGPLGKSVIGLVLALSILIGGLILERRDRYRTFARTAIGGGWALTFFVTFALYHLPAMQVLHSQSADLVLMLTVATAMVAHSLRYRSQVVTSLAFLLAFFTVGISEVTLFSLVAGAILAFGLIAVAFRMRWFELALAGLVGVYVNHFLWLHGVLPVGAIPGHPFANFLPSAALLLLYWLLFRLFYVFRIPETTSQRFSSTLNFVLNSVGLLTLLKYQSAHPEWAFYGLLALGLAELTLAFVGRRRHHDAFVALACLASLLLVAAVPFRFSGASWSFLWLLEAEALFVAGLAMHETVFRRLSFLAAFAAMAQTFVFAVVPLILLRQQQPDATHHLHLTLTLAATAVLFWLNAEFITRRFPTLLTSPIDLNVLRAFSFLATAAATAAIYTAVPGAWTVIAWLFLALALAFTAGKLSTSDLAVQSDIVTLVALIRISGINFYRWDGFPHAPRVGIAALASALLYTLTLRKQPSAGLLRSKDIEPAYSWAAAGVLTLLLWYALQPASTTVAWGFLGLLFLEFGLALRKPHFRLQGIALLVASFLRIGFVNLNLAPTPRLYTVLPLLAAYIWSYERLRSTPTNEAITRLEKYASTTFAWLALVTLTTLLYFQLTPTHVAIGGALLTVALLSLALFLRRPIFTAQALALLVLTTARAIAFNLFTTAPLNAPFTGSRTFSVSLVCAVLFAALPIAFAIRRQPHEASTGVTRYTLHRPEQLLFFLPLGIIAALLFVELRAGMITVGWSTLGLVTFLFALTVGERSFRLAGLGLLLLGVAKILTVDIWHAGPTDRYITLIVMGAALLSVSFLYSRYRETILKLL